MHNKKKIILFSSILVGAPRALSNYSNQQIETGAIYKCDLKQNGNCMQFFNSYGWQNGKDFSGSWLGMSMDGDWHDDQVFVVNF